MVVAYLHTSWSLPFDAVFHGSRISSHGYIIDVIYALDMLVDVIVNRDRIDIDPADEHPMGAHRKSLRKPAQHGKQVKSHPPATSQILTHQIQSFFGGFRSSSIVISCWETPKSHSEDVKKLFMTICDSENGWAKILLWFSLIWDDFEQSGTV